MTDSAESRSSEAPALDRSTTVRSSTAVLASSLASGPWRRPGAGAERGHCGRWAAKPVCGWGFVKASGEAALCDVEVGMAGADGRPGLGGL